MPTWLFYSSLMKLLVFVLFSCTVLVENIKEVRLGKNTETFRICDSSSISFPEDCSFSIIYGDNYDSLDLVASTPDEANIWVTGLAYLTGSNRSKLTLQPSRILQNPPTCPLSFMRYCKIQEVGIIIPNPHESYNILQHACPLSFMRYCKMYFVRLCKTRELNEQ